MVMYENNVVVCGTGGFAQEVIADFRRNVRAVYDPNYKDDEFEGLKVFKKPEDFAIFTPGHFGAVIAVGHPDVAQRIKKELDEMGVHLAEPLISNRAVITGRDTHIGRGSMIMAGTVITEHVSIGECCIINLNCTIGHGAKLGNFVSVMPLTAISGNAWIQDNSYLGSQVFVMEGVVIPEGSTIGAQSGVLKNLQTPNRIWVGTPAKDRFASVEQEKK